MVRVTTTGQVTILTEDGPGSAGYRLGPGRDFWWMTSTRAFRRTTRTGKVTYFPAGTQLGFWDPTHFVVGPDLNLWYVDEVFAAPPGQLGTNSPLWLWCAKCTLE